MQAHGNKVQPLSLNSLLEMSKQLKTQIKAMRKQGNEQTEPLMRTQERCSDRSTHFNFALRREVNRPLSIYFGVPAICVQAHL